MVEDLTSRRASSIERSHGFSSGPSDGQEFRIRLLVLDDARRPGTAVSGLFGGIGVQMMMDSSSRSLGLGRPYPELDCSYDPADAMQTHSGSKMTGQAVLIPVVCQSRPVPKFHSPCFLSHPRLADGK